MMWRRLCLRVFSHSESLLNESSSIRDLVQLCVSFIFAKLPVSLVALDTSHTHKPQFDTIMLRHISVGLTGP